MAVRLATVLTCPSRIPGGGKRFILAQILAASACGGLFPCFWACGEMKGITEEDCHSGQKPREAVASRDQGKIEPQGHTSHDPLPSPRPRP